MMNMHHPNQLSCICPSDVHVSDTVQQIKHSCFWWCPANTFLQGNQMSGNMHLYMYICRALSSKYLCIGQHPAKLVDNPNGLKCTIMGPINVSDTVQQIKQSMFWMVSLTFDLIHFVGHCPANIHVLDIIIVSSKLNISGSAKWT